MEPDKQSPENQVRNFYNDRGWQANSSGDTLDALLWEDLRPCAADYVVACRRKVLAHLPSRGDRLLDAASGPIQYAEYLEYSAGFAKRVCVDISQKALDEAQKKMGSRGETACASLLDLPFDENSFDAVVSLHTIYHIDQKEQEKAVRTLLKVAKPGQPTVIVYSNPDKLLSRIKRTLGLGSQAGEGPLYFHAHPLSWWNRFEDEAEVQIFPWRSLTAQDARRLIPGGVVGKWILKGVLKMEETFPQWAVRFGAYPMIVLTKHKRSGNSGT